MGPPRKYPLQKYFTTLCAVSMTVLSYRLLFLVFMPNMSRNAQFAIYFSKTFLGAIPQAPLHERASTRAMNPPPCIFVHTALRSGSKNEGREHGGRVYAHKPQRVGLDFTFLIRGQVVVTASIQLLHNLLREPTRRNSPTEVVAPVNRGWDQKSWSNLYAHHHPGHSQTPGLN